MSELDELPFPPDGEPLEFERETLATDTYAAVHRGERILLLRDQHPLPERHAEDLAPQARDLEILRALWRYRFLLTSQIADHWWPGRSLYAAQRRLLRMTAAGWVTRFRPRLSKGKHQWIYQLDRKGFELGKRSWGLEGIYAYSIGVRSARAIERRCQEDVAFRVICAGQTPDHATIARFRKRHERAIAELFGGVLELCAQFVDGVEHRPREVVVGQPVLQARRQQKVLVTIAGDEVLGSSHAWIVQNDPDSRGFVRHPPRVAEASSSLPAASAFRPEQACAA